jgi:CHAD domain-containing protein
VDAAGAGKEIEWQLDAQDLRLVTRWLDTAATPDGGAAPLTITPGQTRNHVDTYLDTEDRRLERAGYSVRVRRSRRLRPEATLKSLDGAAANGLRVRVELAEPLESGEPTAVTDAPGEVGRRVRALVGARKLVPLFDLQTRRRVFLLANDRTPSGELLLDETTIREPGGAVASRLRRVEIEVPETALDAAGAFVERLQRGCGLHPAGLSKYEAALAATGRPRPEPEAFGPTAIRPEDTIGHVALAVLRRHFTTLLAKEPGTRLGDDVEELHDMRVASRRLRAAVALFGGALPVEAERLRPELAWIGQTIGAVRDLDVQLVQLDEWVAAAPEPDKEPLGRLRGLLVSEREQARAAMLEALDSPRYERFVRRFGAMLRARTGTRTAPALAVAPDLVEGRHRALRKAMRRARRDGEPPSYHRVRIVGKRFRYALEFLADVYPGQTKQLVRRTVALQDTLGAFQDGTVATARLRELTAGHGAALGAETVFAMGEIAERYRHGMEQALGDVGKRYRELEGKPWRQLYRRLEDARPPLPPPPPLTDEPEAGAAAAE